jgi:hypothetical protein
MKSDCERAASFIDSLDKDQQVAFLARLIYELTLAGRTCYSIDSMGVDCPLLLREINELQHKLSAQIMKLASDGLHLLPSSELVALFLAREYVGESISREIRRSFIDAITASLDQ